MKMVRRILPAAVLLLLTMAPATAAPVDEDAAFGQKVHDWLIAHPEVLEEMTQALEARQAAKIAKIVKSRSAQLFSDPRDPAVGPKKAKVVIALFQDYQCGHCKVEAMPAVVQLVKDHPDLRIVFKELPIFGGKSDAAARAAIAAARQGKYFGVFQALMADRKLDAASIDAALKANGVDLKRAHADAADRTTTALIEDTEALAREVGANGTPTFIIGDKVIIGADVEEIEQAIAAARKVKK